MILKQMSKATQGWVGADVSQRSDEMVSAWAEEEMASADFGDRRLNVRAVKLLWAMGDYPNLSIPAACGGHAEVQAAYRFFDNDKVTLQGMLAPHMERTRQRMAEQKVVLLVQDTTELELTWPGPGNRLVPKRSCERHDLCGTISPRRVGYRLEVSATS
jgi:hypothetical protein